MRRLFDTHRARLTREENERVWAGVRARTVGKTRSGWSIFGAPAALVATGAAVALAVVVVQRDGGPAAPDPGKASAPAPNAAPVTAPAPNAEPILKQAPSVELPAADDLARSRERVQRALRHEETKSPHAGEVEGQVALESNIAPPALDPRTPSTPDREAGFVARGKQKGAGEIRQAPTETASRQEASEPFSSHATGPKAVGGSHRAGDRKIDAMFFRHYGVNPFVETERDALATFAVDVDAASYAIARSYLERGVLPPEDAIRVEEFVNAFDHDYAPPRGDDVADVDPDLTHEGTFAIHLDAAPSPLHENTVLMRVGLKAREVDAFDRKPLNLTFVIDTSGSMNRENRLELVKRSLTELLYRLDAGDEVAIVAYGSDARVVSPPTSVRNRRALEEMIAGLQAGGSTNAEAGLRLGYTIAEAAYDPGEENRVILCSDGVANVGETGPDAILEVIKRSAGRGIGMTAIGVGMGNYNDVLLERLANQADGNYYYVDSQEEARRVLVERMTGTLQTIARDVKIQVELDPRAVKSYRLLGYENRDLADRDFRNDAVDAGEVGPGHEVTALLELHIDRTAERRARAAVVRVRFEDPDTGEITEDYDTLRLSDIARSFERAPASFRLDAAAAGFAEILRGSYWAKDDTLDDVLGIARVVERDVRGRADVAEFVSLVGTARALRAVNDPLRWHEREREWLVDD